ncbi:hypothetical protein JQ543_13730 [Bradyrhizobium diazoefficiens]|nr:hypothetical protein [Bradyrhizobium diazoefficiens]MBR0848808.1 hypothetical protein [Bradyrhizobium diazoefficiens]
MSLSEEPTKAFQAKVLRRLRRRQRECGGPLIKKQRGKWVLTEIAIQRQVIASLTVDVLNKKPVG